MIRGIRHPRPPSASGSSPNAQAVGQRYAPEGRRRGRQASWVLWRSQLDSEAGEVVAVEGRPTGWGDDEGYECDL
jgi:hypothetical protein